MKLEEALKSCFDERGTWYAFVAGSLVICSNQKIDDYQEGTGISFEMDEFSTSVYVHAKGHPNRWLEPTEKVLVAKLYQKHKNNHCAYWHSAHQIIEEVEGINE